MSLHTGPVDIPKMVKRVRERHSMTQSDLADLLGCHVMTVSRWERGEPHQMQGPTKVLLYILANADEAVVAEARKAHESKRKGR